MQKIPFKPLGDRILLKQIPENQQVTETGIVLLDIGNERPKKSQVIATGERTNIKTNAIVLHGRAAGFKLSIDKEEFIIIRESDIFGVIED